MFMAKIESWSEDEVQRCPVMSVKMVGVRVRIRVRGLLLVLG